MALLIYHTFAFISLFSYGLYHLISSTRSFLKQPTQSPTSSSSPNNSYSARPYYPLPLPPHRSHFLRHLPLYLSLLSLTLSLLRYLFLSFTSSTHLFSSLQTTLSLSLFLLLTTLSLFLPLPSDLLFLLSSLSFAILASISSNSLPSDLQSKCDSISSLISSSSSLLSLSLTLFPKMFIFELALSGSLSLQGLWALQTGLSLYVDPFIPQGCHRLLDVRDDSTRCDLEESRVRAWELMDLLFAGQVAFVAVVVVVVYVAVAKCNGNVGLGRRFGSYEALPTSSSSGALSEMDHHHVQMKPVLKNAAQE